MQTEMNFQLSRSPNCEDYRLKSFQSTPISYIHIINNIKKKRSLHPCLPQYAALSD